jgi:outer membrane protein assembly factor BamA
LTSGVYALFGKGFGAEKQLLGADLAQYVKLIGEFRYTWGIDRNQSIATRFLAGTLLAYGGTRYAPYREQFYIGGANSLRAFTVRSIGPGAYPPARNNRYAYLDQTGDMKLEANLEYRFRLIGDLHGAVFLDAGNVWLLREREGIRSGRFSWKNFLNEAALGSGAGIRYDMDILVLRLDCGVALHLPYNTGKSGYFNVHKYSDYLGIHFAVGYPF